MCWCWSSCWDLWVCIGRRRRPSAVVVDAGLVVVGLLGLLEMMGLNLPWLLERESKVKRRIETKRRGKKELQEEEMQRQGMWERR